MKNSGSKIRKLKPGEKRLKTEALVWYKHECRRLGKAEETKHVTEAIRLNTQKRYDAAIRHLQKYKIPMRFGWFISKPKPTSIVYNPMVNLPPHIERKALGSVCPLCKARVRLGTLPQHIGEKHPSEHPVEVRPFPSLPGRQQYVKVKSLFTSRLSDQSGGWY